MALRNLKPIPLPLKSWNICIVTGLLKTMKWLMELEHFVETIDSLSIVSVQTKLYHSKLSDVVTFVECHLVLFTHIYAKKF